MSIVSYSLTVSPTLRSAAASEMSTRPLSSPVAARSSSIRSTRPIFGSARFTESMGWWETGTVNDSRATTRSSS